MTQDSSSIIVTSPPTNQHHAEYQNQSRNDFISNHQTETVISNPFISIDSQTEKTPDLPILTKQHSPNDFKKDVPKLTHKQLINAYIEKKADEILIPFTDKIETLKAPLDAPIFVGQLICCTCFQLIVNQFVVQINLFQLIIIIFYYII